MAKATSDAITRLSNLSNQQTNIDFQQEKFCKLYQLKQVENERDNVRFEHEQKKLQYEEENYGKNQEIQTLRTRSMMLMRTTARLLQTPMTFSKVL